MIELETLLLIQAEAFLSARGAVDMSEGRRNALNALLYQTGQQSYNFMMVLATNRPQDLDSAVRLESSSLKRFEMMTEESPCLETSPGSHLRMV
jgi:ATPase family AAA domain-containing protein 3A/B